MTKRILIIDNDLNTLELFADVFNNENIRVAILQSTNDIFKEIATHQPHLVILDYLLEGINGGELCHQIKTDPVTSKLPVIIVSAFSKVINSLGDYGCDCFIAKPFDIHEVVGRVKQLIAAK